MVMPQQGPPQVDPGPAMSAPPAAPSNEDLAATLPPELLAQIPPEALVLLLEELTPDERQQFVAVDLSGKEDLLLAAAQRLGLLDEELPPEGADLPPNGPPVGAPPGLDAGPPQGMPPGGPLGPSLPDMPPSPVAMPGGGPMPSQTPLAPAPPPPKPKPKPEPEVPKGPPPPDDWEPEPIADLRRESPWRTPIGIDDLVQLADDALADSFWQGRNGACYDQSWCYYRSRDYAKLDGKASNPLAGELLYMLSTPTRNVDRLIARCRPDPDRLVFSLPPRSERKEWRLAAGATENWLRDQWGEDIRRHWDDASRHRPDADLPRRLTQLSVLHGTVGWTLRPDLRRRREAKRDLNATYPFPLEVIPQHELYTFGDLTLRIQSLTLAEARRLDKRVRDKWPTKAAGSVADGGTWSPADDHQCRLISVSDADGLWFGRAFDVWPEAEHRATYQAMWLDKPAPINFGFCAYQLPPGWQATADNALPDRRQAAEDWGRQFARGALFANLGDFKVQDQMASAALSTFLYNRNPAGEDIIDIETRKRAGLGMPKPYVRSMGGSNRRLKDEGYRLIFKDFGNLPGDQFVLSLSFGQTSEAFPAQLGGGGDSASGYDRRQQVEAGQTLHVEEIRRHVAQTVESISRHKVELAHRYGGGEKAGKKYFQGLPYRMSKGGIGEGTLQLADLARSGSGVRVEYHEKDLERDLKLNAVWIPRMKEGIAGKLTTREELEMPEPEREEERIAEDLAMTHPALVEAETEYAMTARKHPLLPFFQAALQRVQDQRAAEQAGGQFPSQAGVPSGGLPSVAQGMPPAMPLPAGVGG